MPLGPGKGEFCQSGPSFFRFASNQALYQIAFNSATFFSNISGGHFISPCSSCAVPGAVLEAVEVGGEGLERWGIKEEDMSTLGVSAVAGWLMRNWTMKMRNYMRNYSHLMCLICQRERRAYLIIETE